LNAGAQNPPGFDLMVRTLLKDKVDTIGSRNMFAQLDKESLVLMDARSFEEYEVSHLPGAVWVGYPEIKREALEGVSKSDEIVVYCSLGKRSEEIADQLQKEGYENVRNHYGGIFDWTNKDLPVVDMQGNSVRRVHPYNDLWGIWIKNYEKVDEPK